MQAARGPEQAAGRGALARCRPRANSEHHRGEGESRTGVRPVGALPASRPPCLWPRHLSRCVNQPRPGRARLAFLMSTWGEEVEFGPLKQRVPHPHRSPNHRTPTTGRSVAPLCGWGRGRGSPAPPRGHSWRSHSGRCSLARSCLQAAERQVQWRGGPLLPTQRFRAPRPLSCLQRSLAMRSWTSGVRPSTAASLLSDLWQLA